MNSNETFVMTPCVLVVQEKFSLLAKSCYLGLNFLIESVV